jgi:uncharacterized protein YndB with AHSA1/START domain
MAVTVQPGYLVIADITGYTAYLARSEIEHAPTIAGDLLETVVGRLEPPFRLAKLEGDACFLYVEDGRAEPSLLLDAVEAAYLAFRRRLRSIETATTCDCQACGLAPRLDLKLFVHHGAYVVGRIAGREELAGPDVILVHRMLKGTSGGAGAQSRGFAVFTAAAVEALGLDPLAMGMLPAGEDVEHIGRVETHVLDLERRWQDEAAQRRLGVAETALFEVSVKVAADAARVWSYLTSPALRPSWEGPIVITEEPVGGRRGVGTTSQCVTGRLATLEEIVDWQPFENVGYRLAVPGIGPVEATIDLETTDGTTDVRLRWALPAHPAADATTHDQALVERLRREKAGAYTRLAALLTGRTDLSAATETRATVTPEEVGK